MTRFERDVQLAIAEVAAARLCLRAATSRLGRAEATLRDLLTRLVAPPPRVPDAVDETVATDPTYPRRRRYLATITVPYTPAEVALLRAAEDFKLREDPDAHALREDAGL